MTKRITRDEAVRMLADKQFQDLSPNEREDLLLDWASVDQDDEEFASLPANVRKALQSGGMADAEESQLLHFALARQMAGFRNEYLANEVSAFVGESVVVVGPVDVLHPCPCCRMRTLRKRGEYLICPVCKWEDDGTSEPSEFSDANNAFLSDAIQMWMKQMSREARYLREWEGG